MTDQTSPLSVSMIVSRDVFLSCFVLSEGCELAIRGAHIVSRRNQNLQPANSRRDGNDNAVETGPAPSAVATAVSWNRSFPVLLRRGKPRLYSIVSGQGN
jgi:hypothetical protein